MKKKALKREVIRLQETIEDLQGEIYKLVNGCNAQEFVKIQKKANAQHEVDMMFRAIERNPVAMWSSTALTETKYPGDWKLPTQSDLDDLSKSVDKGLSTIFAGRMRDKPEPENFDASKGKKDLN